MKNNITLLGVIAIVAVIGLLMPACSGKGGNSGGGRNLTPNPASDFSYDLTADGQGILITGFTGGAGRVVIPATIENLPVLEIGDKVFDGRSTSAGIDIGFAGGGITTTGRLEYNENEKAGITEIIIPNTIRKIGDDAFANTAITSFTMPDSVIEVGIGIFNGCKELTEVRLSDNIEALAGDYGFPALFGYNGSSSLKKINLPRNLKRIGLNAFLGLSELTELVIPDGISVEFGSFDSISGEWLKEGTVLTTFGYEETISSIDVFEGCGKLPLATRQRLRDMGYTGSF